MEIVGMEEWVLYEMLFAQSDGDMSVDELRERLEWEIASCHELHGDPDEEPVISPVSIYMVGYFKRRDEAFNLFSRSRQAFRQAVAEAVDARSARIGKIICSQTSNEKENKK